MPTETSPSVAGGRLRRCPALPNPNSKEFPIVARSVLAAVVLTVELLRLALAGGVVAAESAAAAATGEPALHGGLGGGSDAGVAGSVFAAFALTSTLLASSASAALLMVSATWWVPWFDCGILVAPVLCFIFRVLAVVAAVEAVTLCILASAAGCAAMHFLGWFLAVVACLSRATVATVAKRVAESDFAARRDDELPEGFVRGICRRRGQTDLEEEHLEELPTAEEATVQANFGESKSGSSVESSGGLASNTSVCTFAGQEGGGSHRSVDAPEADKNSPRALKAHSEGLSMVRELENRMKSQDDGWRRRFQELEMKSRHLCEALEAQRARSEALNASLETCESISCSMQMRKKSEDDSVETTTAVVARRVVSAIQADLEKVRRRADDQFSVLRFRIDSLAERVDCIEAPSVSKTDRGQLLDRLKSVQQQSVESLILPREKQDDGQKLALKMLQQASEVAILLCAGEAGQQWESQEMRRLRAKHKSARQLKEVCSLVISEKVRQLLAKPGIVSREAVNIALGNDSTYNGGTGSLVSLSTPSSEHEPLRALHPPALLTLPPPLVATVPLSGSPAYVENTQMPSNVTCTVSPVWPLQSPPPPPMYRGCAVGPACKAASASTIATAAAPPRKPPLGVQWHGQHSEQNQQQMRQ
eukprot:TRINITY_DN49633_c0_g1_i1.p1 TRINITY_DN49633_c0_g1~~TRINITY_DN49633_c0_g1_i1.p1  ORF type:complete len:649 (+),score=116.47 TRINITY_DN49633_c0_g1_i1:108-2054(+)